MDRISYLIGYHFYGGKVLEGVIHTILAPDFVAKVSPTILSHLNNQKCSISVYILYIRLYVV
jgi:hypothetical protein